MSDNEILKTLCESADKGGLLERVLVELLSDLGFSQVRRQLAGSQFGSILALARPHNSIIVKKYGNSNARI